MRPPYKRRESKANLVTYDQISSSVMLLGHRWYQIIGSPYERLHVASKSSNRLEAIAVRLLISPARHIALDYTPKLRIPTA